MKRLNYLEMMWNRCCESVIMMADYRAGWFWKKVVSKGLLDRYIVDVRDWRDKNPTKNYPTTVPRGNVGHDSRVVSMMDNLRRAAMDGFLMPVQVNELTTVWRHDAC